MQDIELVRATWVLVYATWGLVVATFLLAIGTLWFLRRQLQEAKAATELNLHLQLLSAWESDTILAARSRVAATLLRHHEPTANDIETILDNLEGMRYSDGVGEAGVVAG